MLGGVGDGGAAAGEKSADEGGHEDFCDEVVEFGRMFEHDPHFSRCGGVDENPGSTLHGVGNWCCDGCGEQIFVGDEGCSRKMSDEVPETDVACVSVRFASPKRNVQRSCQKVNDDDCSSYPRRRRHFKKKREEYIFYFQVFFCFFFWGG